MPAVRIAQGNNNNYHFYRKRPRTVSGGEKRESVFGKTRDQCF